MAKRKRSRFVSILLMLLLFTFIATIFILIYFKQPIDLGFKIESVQKWFTKITNVSDGMQSSQSQAEVEYKFVILSDSHEDTVVYPQIVDEIADREDISFVVHLGDQSNAGEIAKLQESKDILDSIQAPVYVLPGDHDSNWVPRRDLTNFKQVFGMQQTSFAITYGDERHIFIDNSDGSNGISAPDWIFINRELDTNPQLNKYIFMSTPLSNPYLTFKTMGSQSDKVKKQAGELSDLLKRYDIKAVFAGDTHTFSQYKDEATGIPVVTVGAAGSNKNPLPLYIIVEILSDGGYNVSSVPLKNR